MTSKLSNKQDAFCREYLIDFNATQAAIRAGYSPKSAKQQASRALSKENIQDRIAALKEQADARKDWDAVWVREQMKELLQECRDDKSYSAATSLINTMSRVEGMQTDKHELNGTSPIMFNIRTGKK